MRASGFRGELAKNSHVCIWLMELDWDGSERSAAIRRSRLDGTVQGYRRPDRPTGHPTCGRV